MSPLQPSIKALISNADLLGANMIIINSQKKTKFNIRETSSVELFGIGVYSREEIEQFLQEQKIEPQHNLTFILSVNPSNSEATVKKFFTRVTMRGEELEVSFKQIPKLQTKLSLVDNAITGLLQMMIDSNGAWLSLDAVEYPRYKVNQTWFDVKDYGLVEANEVISDMEALGAPITQGAESGFFSYVSEDPELSRLLEVYVINRPDKFSLWFIEPGN